MKWRTALPYGSMQSKEGLYLHNYNLIHGLIRATGNSCFENANSPLPAKEKFPKIPVR